MFPVSLLRCLFALGLAWLVAACSVADPGTTAAAVVGSPTAIASQGTFVDVARIARDATWAPGALADHFGKHGSEGPWPDTGAYDRSARDTIRAGQPFTYIDRTANVRRRGFYDPSGNRFTSVTEDLRRITTHFCPDNGERYVVLLPESTYRR